MASTVRYRADWTSMDGFEYRIDIIDIDFLGTESNLEIGLGSFDGFTTSYSGNNDGLFNFILASECIINCEVSDAAFETLIDDIVNAQEQRFFVIIYKKNSGNYERFWVGLVLQDLIQMEDLATPYVFQLHATDGLGRLNDIKYPVTSGNSETFIEYIINAISKTELSQFWAPGDIFLRTSVNWYDRSHYTTSPPASTLDPLLVSRVLNDAFMRESDAHEVEGLSCYDVLLQVALRWGAVLVQSNGIISFIQPNGLYPSTFVSRDYNKSGTYLSTNTSDDLKIASSYFNRQGEYSFNPSLLQASIKYRYKQSIYNLGNFLPQQSKYETPVEFGPVQGGNTETLIFVGSVRVVLDLGILSSVEAHRWAFKMRIQVSIYYLTNENGYDEWTTDTSKRYICKSPIYIGTHNYNDTFVIAFESQFIPVSGDGIFEFNFFEFQEIDGTTLVLPSGVTTSYSCYSFTLRQNIEDEFESGDQEYVAINEDSSSNPVSSKSKYELPDSNTGEGPNEYCDGRIQIYTPGSVWQNSGEEWTVGGASSGGININALLCTEAVAAQKIPVSIYSGKVEGNGLVLLPMNAIFINTNKFLLRSGTFNANSNTWEGDWSQISIDRTNIEIEETTTADKERILTGLSLSVDNIQKDMDRQRENSSINGYRSIITADHNIEDGQSILYSNPGVSGLNIKLPDFDKTVNRSFIIVNISSIDSLTILRYSTSDLLNGVTSDYTLVADTSIEIHNSGIASIGWVTVYNSARK